MSLTTSNLRFPASGRAAAGIYGFKVRQLLVFALQAAVHRFPLSHMPTLE